MYKPVAPILHSLLLIILMGTFYSAVYYINAEPRVTSASAVEMPPTPVPTVIQTLSRLPDKGDTGWTAIQPGLERRLIQVYNNQNQSVESVYLWRLDQKFFRLDVAFSETPKSMESWQRETNAALVVNGGYYSVENERYFPDGLTIIHGKNSGRSFAGFGGMLAILQDRAELRWLVEKAYNPSESLQAALQSFPILVQPGGQLGFGTERENQVKARRTVIAQDKAGRILFILAPQGYFTLHQLSVYLTDSDLNLDIAVNLDGGGSTGMMVANPREVIPPTRPIPFVILVYAR